MTLRLSSLALCSLTLFACGGSVAVSATGTGGTSTTTGSTGDVGGGDVGGSGGSGGWGGEGGFGGGTGGGPGTCDRTNDGFDFTLASSDGQTIGCSSAQPGGSQSVHIEGVVISSSPTDLAIDTCPPNADCNGTLFYKLSIQSPGFSMGVAPGTFVQIDLRIDFPWGCSNIIMARNLPVWAGLSSPGGNVPNLIFAGSDGSPTTLDGMPFSLGTTALGCHPGAEPGCGLEDEHRFDISTPVGGAAVYQGETKYFDTTEGNEIRTMQFRNLRSYETGWCDDYWNWGYWAVPAPLLGD